MDGQKTLQDIKNMIADEFEVSDPIVEQDLTEFVADLEKIDAIY
jgi:hypothetical protein